MSAEPITTTDKATTTTLAALQPPRETPIQNMPAIRSGFDSLQSFELAQRAGKALAASSLVPQVYQGNLPNCLIALEMAQRIGASPLMVMQNLYVVQGRPSWSAVFLIASFNQCGRFSSLRYEWIGEKGKDSYGCRAWAVEKATGEKIVGSPITWDLVKAEGWEKKQGSKWKTMPDQMFMYRAASWFVKAYAPEISMGLSTAEEVRDVLDAAPGADGEFRVTTESLRRAEPESQAVEINTEAGEVGETAPRFGASDAL